MELQSRPLIHQLKEEIRSAVNLSFSFRTPLTFYHLWAHLLKGKLLTQGMSPKNKKTFITFMRIQQKKIPRPQHINEKEKEEIDAAVEREQRKILVIFGWIVTLREMKVDRGQANHSLRLTASQGTSNIPFHWFLLLGSYRQAQKLKGK